MHPADIIRRPLLSEKSLHGRDDQSKYAFIVDKAATKDEIAKAVETLFDVKPIKVNTLINRGKFKRRGMYISKKSNVKKALVTLEPGSKIAFFEDQ